jgi:hypothetical protein
MALPSTLIERLLQSDADFTASELATHSSIVKLVKLIQLVVNHIKVDEEITITITTGCLDQPIEQKSKAMMSSFELAKSNSTNPNHVRIVG